MTIYRPINFIEEYRIRASSNDIGDLSGRIGRPDLTHFVIGEIISKIDFEPIGNVVDIGCGDGAFLRQIAELGGSGAKGRLIGILPTEEEVCRVSQHLNITNNDLIDIQIGHLEKTNLPDEFADLIVTNSTISSLISQAAVSAALLEIKRITKKGGKVFIGELSDTDEMAGKDYGDSITAWLAWVLKNQGVKKFGNGLKRVLISLFTAEPFIISSKEGFFMNPNNFIALLESNGFQILKYYRHKEIDLEQNVHDSATRWNYLVSKPN
jgi:ubiquinone/menaquinone biosynthesis C-methylase UbiE